MIAFAASLGYTVSFEPIAGSAGGWCDTRAERIVVDTKCRVNARLRTLVHESVHALGVDYQHHSRAQAEVIIDTTTLVVLLGLDVSGETVPYVAGWGEDGGLEAVTQPASSACVVEGALHEALYRDLRRRLELLHPAACFRAWPRSPASTQRASVYEQRQLGAPARLSGSRGRAVAADIERSKLPVHA